MSQIESRLVVYSSIERELCGGLVEGFMRRHPHIDVDFRGGISVALHERYLERLKAGEPDADLVWSTAMDLQMGLVLAGHAIRYRSPHADGLPEGAVYDDMAYATTVEPLMTVVNRDLFDAGVPAGSLSEISNALAADTERFRGRVACYDIERNGLGFLALLHESRRDPAFDAFLNVLASCQPRAFESNPQVIEEVASGRAALAFHVLGSFARRMVQSNAVLEIAATRSPSLAVSRVAFVPVSAPHPENGKLFLDYLISREGQQKIDGAGLYAIRPDAAKSSAATTVPILLNQCCGEALDEQRRQALLGRWRTALGFEPAAKYGSGAA
jgi:iron(III) transport system substrate-binding protein